MKKYFADLLEYLLFFLPVVVAVYFAVQVIGNNSSLQNGLFNFFMGGM